MLNFVERWQEEPSSTQLEEMVLSGMTAHSADYFLNRRNQCSDVARRVLPKENVNELIIRAKTNYDAALMHASKEVPAQATTAKRSSLYLLLRLKYLLDLRTDYLMETASVDAMQAARCFTLTKRNYTK
jgi:hypothetical protein